MLTPSRGEDLRNQIIYGTIEALDLEEFGSRGMPLLDRLLDTSTSLLYHCNENREICPIAGDMAESIPLYSRNYFAIDPLQEVLVKQNPSRLHSADLPNWEYYLSSAAYNECATRNGIDHFIHLRLSDGGMYDPGMVGIMVARTFRQADFGKFEMQALQAVLPAVAGLVRRNDRLKARGQAYRCLESLYEFDGDPSIVLTLNGGLVWAAERADALLRVTSGDHKAIPEVLASAARRLGRMVGERKVGSGMPPVSLSIPRPGLAPVRAELRAARAKSGEYFLVAELEDPSPTLRLMDLASRHHLTKTESRVLQLLSLGLSDKEIAARLFVSAATVHSHVNHVLRKMGLNSRVHAILRVHGVKGV